MRKEHHNKVKIIAHCLVKNEARWVWYSINSVLPYVDNVMVWDTGSIDATVEIVKNINSPKIQIRTLSEITAEEFPAARQEMFDITGKEFTWVLILDGDEIWEESAIKTVTKFARDNPQYESIVVRSNNLVGDIFHRLPESSGHYNLAGLKGHLNLRLLNLKKIPGINVKKPHGQQGYYDKNGVLVQDRDPRKIKFIDVYYHHATHLPRAGNNKGDQLVPKRPQKLKYELGQEIPQSQIPQVFFLPHPADVPRVINRAPLSFWVRAAIETMPRRIKRALLPLRHGY